MSHVAPHDAERRIDNIEFNVADIARSKRFYGEVFGWHFTDYGPAYTEFDDGRLKGGFVADAPVRAHGGPLVILYCADLADAQQRVTAAGDRKSTRLNSSHSQISYAVFCLKKKKKSLSDHSTSRRQCSESARHRTTHQR